MQRNLKHILELFDNPCSNDCGLTLKSQPEHDAHKNLCPKRLIKCSCCEFQALFWVIIAHYMHNHAQIRMDVPMDKLAGDFKDSNLVTARTLKTFINGDACSYTGQWLDDEPSGWGKLEREDFIYEGFFSGGAMQTYGRFVYLEQGKEVKTYYGLHQNGKFEFFGKLDDEKITFTGSFLDGEMRTGELFYKDNGQKYVGSFLNNLPQGNGKLTFKNGSFFEGGFHHGKFHDKGIFKSISNECLEGSWVYGIKTGFFNRNRLNGVICKEKYDHDEFQFV